MTKKWANSVCHAIQMMLEFIKARKRYVTVLAYVVVFIVTYALILPSYTLDEDEAEKQGGIDVHTQTEETVATDETSGKDSSEDTVKNTEEKTQVEPIEFKTKEYEIAVTYDEKAKIPDGAKLQVEEILPEDKEYADYYEKAVAAAKGSKSEKYVRFFDITILDGKKKIEPKSDVQVDIKLTDTNKTEEDWKVVHFSTDGPEVIKPEDAVQKKGNTELSFLTDSFSVYAVIVDADHGSSSDLNGKSFKIGNGNDYLSNSTDYNNTPWIINKTDVNNAAEYTFEATGTPGVYRIYTMVNGQKYYIHINQINDNSANVNLHSPDPMDLQVVQNSDGTYSIYRTQNGTNYYLNKYGNSNGFGGWHSLDNNSKFDFVSAGSGSLQAGKPYIVLAKIDDHYYIVNNDGSLTSVEYDPATNKVKVENPMMWTYTGSNLYHNTEAVDFDGSQVASDFYYKYIDPSEASAISEDDKTNTEQEVAGHKDGVPYYRVVNGSRTMQSHSALTYENKHLKSNNGDYYIGVKEENGELKLAGGQDSAHAVEILFATPEDVLPVDSRNHTVSHIDISIEGTSEVDVPLAYGKYYDKDGNMILEVSDDKTITLKKEGIGISTKDMKKATIVAYTKTADGQSVPIDDAFYITGYSANSATEYSTPQVRIEGSFKVADLDPDQNVFWNVHERLNHKIYYSVTAIKSVTFDVVDPELGQLYDADGKKLTITIDVAFSASFDYWDERNECPPVRWSLDSWRGGNIIGGSGMDFVLGGDAEQAGSNIVAIEITKLLVDEQGHRIKPSASTPVRNKFEIYQDKDGNPNSVIGLGIDGKPNTASYQDYINLHSKELKVGEDGMGLIYEYDVTPGMYYIREDPSSIRDELEDTDGNEWHYVETRILTESPWRDDAANDGKMHVSDTYTKSSGSYNAVPEVLGNYPDIHGNTTWVDPKDHETKPIRNGFLEFYVYNVYRASTCDFKIQKTDANGNGLEGAVFQLKTVGNDGHSEELATDIGGIGTVNVDGKTYESAFETTGNAQTLTELPDGTYRLYEVYVPEGYVNTLPYIEFKIENHEMSLVTSDSSLSFDAAHGNSLALLKVKNTPGAELPSAGGPGTHWIYLLGALLLIGCGTILVARRRVL